MLIINLVMVVLRPGTRFKISVRTLVTPTVTGAREEEHQRNVEEVLSRLKKSRLRLKRSKCEFLGKEVVFLGHRIRKRADNSRSARSSDSE